MTKAQQVERADREAELKNESVTRGGFPAESDDRAEDQNRLRHTYRVLTDQEKEHMATIKDKGEAFLRAIQVVKGREGALAETKVEEAVMWAVKGLTK